MFPKEDPAQLSFFPELPQSSTIPSIATVPEFDRALSNLIKMSDLGAFIQLNIQGLEKGYSLNLTELPIPADFLNLPPDYSPLSVHLFPPQLRNRIKKLTYEVKAFFNPHNSFHTSFGYFLFRSHFKDWKDFLERQRDAIHSFLSTEMKKGRYGHYFLDHFQQGYEHFRALAEITAPWEFRERILLKEVEAQRKRLNETHQTLHTLKATEIDYPFQSLVLKTNHIPMVLHQYLQQVQIHSVFKTIHLEYLSNIEINSIDDIRRLTEGI